MIDSCRPALWVIIVLRGSAGTCSNSYCMVESVMTDNDYFSTMNPEVIFKGTEWSSSLFFIFKWKNSRRYQLSNVLWLMCFLLGSLCTEMALFCKERRHTATAALLSHSVHASLCWRVLFQQECQPVIAALMECMENCVTETIQDNGCCGWTWSLLKEVEMLCMFFCIASGSFVPLRSLLLAVNTLEHAGLYIASEGRCQVMAFSS